MLYLGGGPSRSGLWGEVAYDLIKICRATMKITNMKLTLVMYTKRIRDDAETRKIPYKKILFNLKDS